jgi:ABC-type amino acid transport substrate-binding protein
MKQLFIFISIILFTFLSAAQCQTEAPPAAPTATTIPALLLRPPIQPGDGTDLMDRLLERGVIRVGVRVWPEADFAPPVFRGFSESSISGTLTGFEIDIARQVAEGLGLELELIEANPHVIISGDWRGGWDIAMASLAPFDQPLEDSLAQSIVYSVPYGYMPMGLLIPAAEDDIHTLAELSGKQVGVLEHSAHQRLFTPAEGPLTVQGQRLTPAPPDDLQLIIVSNLIKDIRELGQSEPQLDAIFGPSPILRTAAERGIPVKMASEAEVIGYQPMTIATVPQEGLKVERLIAEINTILIHLQRQGTLAEIYLNWYNQDLSQVP